MDPILHCHVTTCSRGFCIYDIFRRRLVDWSVPRGDCSGNGIQRRNVHHNRNNNSPVNQTGGKREGSGFPSNPSFPIFIPYVSLGIVLISMALFLFFVFVIGWIWGAGYEPTNRRIRRQLLELLERRFQPNDTFIFYDLGSGFGGVLVDVAEKFPRAFCTGIETDSFKCAVGNRRVRKRGLSGRVVIIRGNLLKLYFSDADVVYMFLSPLILKKKEFKERLGTLKPGCLVISYCHQIPMVAPAAIIGKNLFIYSRNSS